MGNATRYSPEVRERAVRLVLEQVKDYSSQWAAIRSITEKFGCSPETLREWVRKEERDHGDRAGLSTNEREELKRLQREVRELRRTNEILKAASMFFAKAEFDRQQK